MQKGNLSISQAAPQPQINNLRHPKNIIGIQKFDSSTKSIILILNKTMATHMREKERKRRRQYVHVSILTHTHTHSVYLMVEVMVIRRKGNNPAA